MRISRSLCAIFFLAGACALAQNQPENETTILAATKALNLLLSERYRDLHAMFTGPLAAELTEDAVRQRLNPQLKAMGKLEPAGPPQLLLTPKGSDVIFELQSPAGRMGVLLSVDPIGRIAGISLRKQKMAALWTNPPYSDLQAFEAQSLEIGEGQWKLPGTLLKPKGKGPFPAVVLAHGSPPYDRDEAIEVNKPFRDIAEGLASRGVAVLRFENRSRAYAQQLAGLKSLTIQQQIVDDAVAAAALLRKQPGIDGKQIYLLGHNTAAYIAPRIAHADPKLAGLILLAANVTPLDELVVVQAKNVNMPEAQLKQIRDEAAKVKKISAGQQALGEPASFWIDLKDYNPVLDAKALHCRILFLQGGRDFQVPPKELASWRTALGNKPGVTFREYPTLNHYFIAGEGKSSLEEYKKPGHVAADVIAGIAAWVKQ